MKSQCNQILRYLQSGKSITPLQALKKFGCFRLGARVWDLRDKGHDIRSELVKIGEKRVAKYWLKNS